MKDTTFKGKGYKTIRIPYENEAIYSEEVKASNTFRVGLDQHILNHPELFPPEIEQGYVLVGIALHSKKQDILIRRVRLKSNNETYQISPSFVMPYMSARTDEVSKALLLQQFGVPDWVLAHVFGRDAMFYYRLQNHFGRFSIVGTTLKSETLLPEHLIADEKHTYRGGDKAYIATTVASGCILGASISEQVSENALSDAYVHFKDEAQDMCSTYAPKTVNTDDWAATKGAWKALFASITLISCFLHWYLSLKTVATKATWSAFSALSDRLWSAYDASNKRSYGQRMRRFREYASTLRVSKLGEKALRIASKCSWASGVYVHSGAYRTSNMLDRLMHRMDKWLYNGQYFKGHRLSAERSIRSFALIQNFMPSCPATIKKREGWVSPAAFINQKQYADSWLQNLITSASLNGYRTIHKIRYK